MAFFILPLFSARELDIGPRAIWKRPCINLLITYFARADNMLLPWGQITRHKLCFYYTCKFSVISIEYVITFNVTLRSSLDIVLQYLNILRDMISPITNLNRVQKYKINLYNFSFQRRTKTSHIYGLLFVS